MRLAEQRLLETSWETAEESKPPRHIYKLTQSGLRYALEQVNAHHEPVLKEPAFGGAGSL
jgi:PadR family transcriptional regulator, regulatory protein PadR